jgi:hypothetical protein
MRILILLSALALLGCETTAPGNEDARFAPTETPYKSVTPAPEIHFSKVLKDASLSFTGRNVYVDLSRASEITRCMTDKELAAIKKAAEEQLRNQGFTVLTQARKAHSELIFICDKYQNGASESNNAVLVTETTSKFENGKLTTETKTYYSGGNWQRFSFGWVTHEHGRRERTAFTLSLSADKNKWENLKPQIAKRIVEELTALNLKPPAEDLKMAGDPACQPRFGFLAPAKMVNGETKFIVTEVLPESPAKRAGIRLGDAMLALDSVEYSDSAFPDSLYEVKAAVPVKFSRNGKVIRSSITSQVICPK